MQNRLVDLLYPDSGAEFSPCRIYRYTLWRFWNRTLPFAMFIGLIPSTADETGNDPIVRRCIRFARDWGYGGLLMTNAFGIRATDPKVMLAHNEPNGEGNDDWLRRVSEQAGVVVAAWGNHGAHRGRSREIRAMLGVDIHQLGVTKSGEPKHPLYLRSDTKPELLT